ncbi:MAG TPA: M23 family metallopeptidase [Rhizomicrobium sp.]|nr:M23 family metallopeptidase [Rhizomicrobium sp.]
MKYLVPVFFLASAFASAGAPIALDLPVDCRIGQTCFIQQYFDHDPGPGAKDYRCGALSYDRHDGTDFRLSTLAAQKRGVNVLAAAAGTVKGVRDSMADADVRIAGVESVKGRECGNGVVLVHANGWETQYCHLAVGSVRVRVGEQVKAGAVLGRIGESGDAAFPHLHLSVRHDGQKVDPFAFGAAACGGGTSLWSARAKTMLVYRSPQLINSGFAGAPVTMDDIEAGVTPAPTAQAPALVAFVRAIGLAAGDIQTIAVRAPDGSNFVDSRAAPLDHYKAQWMMIAGKKNTGAGFARGTYAAHYSVERSGRTVLDKQFSFELR